MGPSVALRNYFLVASEEASWGMIGPYFPASLPAAAPSHPPDPERPSSPGASGLGEKPSLHPRGGVVVGGAGLQ